MWGVDMDSVARQLTHFGLKDSEPGPDILPAPSWTKARLPGLTEDQLNHNAGELTIGLGGQGRAPACRRCMATEAR